MSPEQGAGESPAPGEDTQPNTASNESETEPEADLEQVEGGQQALAARAQLTAPPSVPPVVDVYDLDWDGIGASL